MYEDDVDDMDDLLDLDEDDDLDPADSFDDLEQEAHFRCPWCAEIVSVLVDLSSPDQAYVEDCEVCCRPIALHVRRSGGRVVVEARAEG